MNTPASIDKLLEHALTTVSAEWVRALDLRVLDADVLAAHATTPYALL